jgi:hypothetical protein
MIDLTTLVRRLRFCAANFDQITRDELDEAADELERLNAQALELCAEISGLRRELAEIDGMLVEAWTLMIDGKVAEDFGDRLQQWIDARQTPERRVTTRTAAKEGER